MRGARLVEVALPLPLPLPLRLWLRRLLLLWGLLKSPLVPGGRQPRPARLLSPWVRIPGSLSLRRLEGPIDLGPQMRRRPVLPLHLPLQLAGLRGPPAVGGQADGGFLPCQGGLDGHPQRARAEAGRHDLGQPTQLGALEVRGLALQGGAVQVLLQGSVGLLLHPRGWPHL